MKILAILALCLFLVGCNTAPKVKIREVPVPIVVYRDVLPADVEEMPRLPIYNLTSESSEDEIAVAISESIVILESQRKQLEEAVRPFRDSRDTSTSRFESQLQQYRSDLDEVINSLRTPVEDFEEENE